MEYITVALEISITGGRLLPGAGLKALLWVGLTGAVGTVEVYFCYYSIFDDDGTGCFYLFGAGSCWVGATA